MSHWVLAMLPVALWGLSLWLTRRFSLPESVFYIPDPPNDRSLHDRPVPRSGGVAILTNCVLRIVDWTSGRDLYRHPAYRAPDLAIRRATEGPALPWEVLHDGTVAACFADIGKAGAYVAFMCGEVVDPRVFR